MRNALLVNGNGPVGRAACRALVAGDWRVAVTCLSEGTASSELDVHLMSGEDMASPSFANRISSRLIQEIRPAVIDLLVFNCELSCEHPWGLPHASMFPDEHCANELRVRKVVSGLAPHLSKGGKVIVVAGCVMTLSARLPGTAAGFRTSAVASQTVEKYLAPELSERRVSATCVHPKLSVDKRYDGSVVLSGVAMKLPAPLVKVTVEQIRKFYAAECSGFCTNDGRLISF